MGRGGWEYGEGRTAEELDDSGSSGPPSGGQLFDWSQSADPVDRDWTPRPHPPHDPYPGVGANSDRHAPPLRDPSDPRRYPFAPQVAIPGRTVWRAGAGLPTLPTLLIAVAAVVFAFVIGHATGGGGSSTAAVATKPAATVATTTTTTVPVTTHTVGRGESLSSIASNYGLTTRDLAGFNSIGDVNHVFVGEVLKIPPPTTPTTAPAKTKH